MKVSLLIPCFVDQFYPKAAEAVVTVLERLGHEVDYPEAQTCCGQPPFNSGFWDESRQLAERNLDIFESAEVVVSPSASCTTMLRVFYKDLFQETTHRERAERLSAKVYEFSEFLVRKLGVTDVGARFKGKVTFHDGCHGLRELGLKQEPRQLLRSVQGLELLEMDEAETCCGFGGTFSVKFPAISTAMDEVKCHSVLRTGAEYVVSCDLSCLMQIDGWLRKQGKPVSSLHLAEVLASR
jgi:L-lactate dehydrogenase complex protein LldE